MFMYKLIKAVIQNMYVLKKDLEKYKNMYKYNYKLLDILVRYSLSLLKENIKENNDIEYLNNVILDVNKLLILTDELVFYNINRFNIYFKENEKHTLINDSEHSKKIKEYYDELAKLFVKGV